MATVLPFPSANDAVEYTQKDVAERFLLEFQPICSAFQPKTRATNVRSLHGARVIRLADHLRPIHVPR